MQLVHLNPRQLSISALNMRHGKALPDLSDILPSIRARGVLVPLLVRPAGEADRFEIVAGRRRFHAALAIEAESGLEADLPCAVLGDADDADALEASLLENIAREQPHEVELWTSFTKLVRESRKPEEIALTFSLSERRVAQILALGALNPKLRDLYRREEIDVASIRLLTMASARQQKEWLKLAGDPKLHAPTGMRLKAWLFGGSSIPATAAIFDLDNYHGELVTDLFGEERYFADAEIFWAAQRAAIETKRQSYLEAGWKDVVVLEPGSYFASWDFEKVPRTRGGKVFIALSAQGDVSIHEGYLTNAEARRQLRNDDAESDKPKRPELTGPLQNYADLHRHTAVRTALLDAPGVALRLLVAHSIIASPLFLVRPDPRRPANPAIAESSEVAPSEARFDERRRHALDLLGLDPDSPTLIQGYGGARNAGGTAGLFLKLLDLPDEAVLALAAVAMGELLESGSAVVEALGFHLGVDMSKAWAPDEAFYEQVRDKELLAAMVGELAGADVASANAGQPAKALKAIVRDCLDGANGRERVHGWVPRFMRFPPAAYTARGGVGTVRRFLEVAPLIGGRSPLEPGLEPDAEAESEAEPLAA